ncbi:unnamed protein product [Ascophyllum nodosum]
MDEDALRRRPGHESLGSSTKVESIKNDRRLEGIIENIADKSPPWLAKFLRGFAPFVTVFFITFSLIGPVLLWFYGLMYKIYTILPVNVLGMVYGLAMCFFGGFFHVTIAAIETFNMTGGEKIWLYICELTEDLKELHRASVEDDKRDDDNDGVPDIKQASLMLAEKFVTRKAALAFRVINPDRATNAITGIWQGYMGVLVILKFRFAKVVSLAVSIGNHMRPLVGKLFGRFLAAVIPEEYHQWIDPIINYFCKLVAMTIAWWIHRFISTVQSAIEGGLLFSRSLLGFISDVTPLKLHSDESFVDEIIGWTMAACGAYFQIAHNWDLPWFVDLLLWPAYVLEFFLEWSVTWMGAPTAVP